MKPGVRALGVAESFRKRGKKSLLAGVVLRSDGPVDGVALESATVGGMDATDGILRLHRALRRDDVPLLFLGGCVISWFNIVDLERVHRETRIPLVCVTYEESPGLEGHLRDLFPEDGEERVALYRSLGKRERFRLATGHDVYARFLGLTRKGAQEWLDRFTRHGKVPEPVRVARLVARAALNQSLNP
ncbi:MAG: DUF99 family protein [Halobacteria archaeon]